MVSVPRLAPSLFAVALLLAALPAWGAQRRVALIDGDAELLRALSLALSAWDVATIPVSESVPASSQPDAMREAAQLVARLQVDGIVWTSETAEGSLLWVYDAATGQITARALTERSPFSSATAAGLALSVKTALRPSVEPPPAPAATTAPAATAPTAAQAPLAPTPPEPGPARVLLRAGLDAQVLSEHLTRAWFSLGSVVWLGAHRRVGAGLRLGLGPELAITGPRFSGHFRELSFGPVAEFRLLSWRRFVGSAFIAGAAHASFLDGTLSRDGARVEAKRYTVSVDAGAQFEMAVVGGVLVGVNAQAAYFTKYQRYLVEGRAVFAPWRVSPAAGAHLALELP